MKGGIYCDGIFESRPETRTARITSWVGRRGDGEEYGEKYSEGEVEQVEAGVSHLSIKFPRLSALIIYL